MPTIVIIMSKDVIIFLFVSLTYGAWQNCLIETVLLSIHNLFLIEK